jgi:hypothetical protein
MAQFKEIPFDDSLPSIFLMAIRINGLRDSRQGKGLEAAG